MEIDFFRNIFGFGRLDPAKLRVLIVLSSQVLVAGEVYKGFGRM